MSLLRYESQVRPALVEGDKDYHQVTEDICRPVEARPSKLWWKGFIIWVLLKKLLIEAPEAIEHSPKPLLLLSARRKLFVPDRRVSEPGNKPPNSLLKGTVKIGTAFPVALGA